MYPAVLVKQEGQQATLKNVDLHCHIVPGVDDGRAADVKKQRKLTGMGPVARGRKHYSDASFPFPDVLRHLWKKTQNNSGLRRGGSRYQ